MNNVPTVDAAPWYFTAVVAGITALSTLLAGGVTTWLTLRYSNLRLATEMKHQRSQERYKLLYVQRVELYNKLNNQLAELLDVYAKIEDYTGSSEHQISDEQAREVRQVYFDYVKLFQAVGNAHVLLLLIASPLVNEKMQTMQSAVEDCEDAIDRCSVTRSISIDNFHEKLNKLTSAYRELTSAMHVDLGVVDLGDV